MTKGKVIGSAIGVGVLGLGALFLAFRPAAKEAPPCQPWPSCYAVSTPTPLPTLAPLPTATATSSPTSVPTTVTPPTPTPESVRTATPEPVSRSCSATVVGSLPPAGGKFAGSDYSDSLSIGGGRLFERLNHGVRVWRLNDISAPIAIWDLEARPGYTKTGDGFQTVSKVGASEDGTQVLVAWKTDLHRVLLVNARSGGIVSEVPPTRAFGGVAISGGRGLALTTSALWSIDLQGLTSSVVQGAPGGVPGSLVSSGRWAAYTGVRGELVTVRDGTHAQTISDVLASAVGIEGERLVVGLRQGYAIAGVGGLVGAAHVLPETPSVVALLGGRAWAALSDGLYCNGARVLTVPWSPKVMRGSGDLLYVGIGSGVRVVRVGP